MKKTVLLLLVLIACCLPACVSKHMQPAPPPATASSLTENQSAVVFFRPSILGSAIQAPIVEAIENNDVAFVGILSAKMKLLYRTTPGKRHFIVGGESASLLEANLEGGKYYYVEVDPRMGMWKARFAIIPVTAEKLKSEDFLKELAKCDWFQSGPSAQQWFADNRESLREKRTVAFEKNENADGDKRAVLQKSFGGQTLLR
jgi:hypothetical protein